MQRSWNEKKEFKKLGTEMPMREKDRKLRRRQRRRRKIRKLKEKLAKTETRVDREGIIEKLRRLHPWIEIPIS
jgi:hypothetical protein